MWAVMIYIHIVGRGKSESFDQSMECPWSLKSGSPNTCPPAFVVCSSNYRWRNWTREIDVTSRGELVGRKPFVIFLHACGLEAIGIFSSTKNAKVVKHYLFCPGLQ